VKPPLESPGVRASAEPASSASSEAVGSSCATPLPAARSSPSPPSHSRFSGRCREGHWALGALVPSVPATPQVWPRSVCNTCCGGSTRLPWGLQCSCLHGTGPGRSTCALSLSHCSLCMGPLGLTQELECLHRPPRLQTWDACRCLCSLRTRTSIPPCLHISGGIFRCLCWCLSLALASLPQQMAPAVPAPAPGPLPQPCHVPVPLCHGPELRQPSASCWVVPSEGRLVLGGGWAVSLRGEVFLRWHTRGHSWVRCRLLMLRLKTQAVRTCSLFPPWRANAFCADVLHREPLPHRAFSTRRWSAGPTAAGVLRRPCAVVAF